MNKIPETNVLHKNIVSGFEQVGWGEAEQKSFY